MALGGSATTLGNYHSGVGNANRRRRRRDGSPGRGFRIDLKPPPVRGFKPIAGKPDTAAGAIARGNPAKPKPNNAQPDSIYNNQVDLANKRESQALSDLDKQEKATKFDFGIDDPTNAFSRLEGLKRFYLAQSRGASVGLAAQGHLTSGAHERALSRVRFQDEEARAKLRQQYMALLDQIGSERAGVQNDSEEARDQAFQDWLDRAPDSEGSVPAAPKPPTTTSTASSSSPAPKPPAAGNTVGGASPAAGAKGNAPREILKPVKGPDKPRGDVEKRLREKLRAAQKAGNTKRARRIRTRIRNLHRGEGLTRG